MDYSQSTIILKSKTAAYFNLNNNGILKELLVNKFNMILDNQARLVLNEQSITSPDNEPQRSPKFVQKQPSEVFLKISQTSKEKPVLQSRFVNKKDSCER